jgi:hypothetical protein
MLRCFVDVAVVNKKTGERTKVDKHEVAKLDPKVWGLRESLIQCF